MRKEILTKEQVEILPLVREFSKQFGLVGGTAMALYIGHRESVDFDLFSLKEFSNLNIKRRIEKFAKIDEVLVNKLSEFTVLINEVKMTFYHYPFEIKFSENFEDIIKLPDLLTLSAMKAHALGQRAKWKDYVDLYFVMKDFHSLDEIIKKAREIFGNEFNEKIFKVQLAYFDDISYSEKVVYKKGYAVDDEMVKKKLVEFSLS